MFIWILAFALVQKTRENFQVLNNSYSVHFVHLKTGEILKYLLFELPFVLPESTNINITNMPYEQ